MPKKSIGPLATGKVSENIFAIKTRTVNFFVFQYAEITIAIDSGFGKNLILSQLKYLGLDPKNITHVFLTHSDFDHTGGVNLFENAKVYLSADEETMITGKRARMLGFVYNSRIKKPYQLLNDNDVVSLGRLAIHAITTPGHTPGSMSYLVNESILFVGDTFKLIDDRVYPLRRYINMDTEQQKASIRKLARLDGVKLACTAHTGYTKAFDQAIQAWK